MSKSTVNRPLADIIGSKARSPRSVKALWKHIDDEELKGESGMESP